MKIYKNSMNKNAGYAVAVAGIALTLIWIGVFKFTPTEAKGIQPLVAHHFAMSWMYSLWTVQTASNVIGVVEILTGLGLAGSLFFPKLGRAAGWASAVIFATTLSFLFTTPGVWTVVDGVPTTDFFIVKDVVALGVSLMVIRKSTQ